MSKHRMEIRNSAPPHDVLGTIPVPRGLTAEEHLAGTGTVEVYLSDRWLKGDHKPITLNVFNLYTAPNEELVNTLSSSGHPFKVFEHAYGWRAAGC